MEKPKQIDWKNVLWAAKFENANNSKEAGFTKVQTQENKRSKILTDRSTIPVVNVPNMGRALEFKLISNQMRQEANPNRNNILMAETTYHAFAFMLDDEFPKGINDWQVIWQLHGNDQISPRYSLQLRNNELRIGDSKGDWSPEIHNKSRYRVILKCDKQKGLISVWVNGNWLLVDFYCGKSKTPYYQKHGWYHNDKIRGGRMWQNGHSMGHTFEAVKQFL